MAGNEPDDEARIRELAYFLWKDAGSPEGMASAHWEQASRMLSGQASGGEPLEMQATAAAKAGEEAKAVAARARKPKVIGTAAAEAKPETKKAAPKDGKAPKADKPSKKLKAKA
ncbi:DUF2934 domain-containing protein [Roseomonas gilardii]|uniref:DUF2934 domain-containing protein n=1 Tax=Roseomonas gilardii TaxID=257708 RepID=UPI0004834ED0|nr:DUF2934 domain-containing protein [Roseomonas gilardii]SUE44289.1 Protein of uncharacterised function (DUF2934) [Roseomonas gilardii subsp. rosea]